jgi:hypothetical protein
MSYKFFKKSLTATQIEVKRVRPARSGQHTAVRARLPLRGPLSLPAPTDRGRLGSLPLGLIAKHGQPPFIFLMSISAAVFQLENKGKILQIDNNPNPYIFFSSAHKKKPPPPAPLHYLLFASFRAAKAFKSAPKPYCPPPIPAPPPAPPQYNPLLAFSRPGGGVGARTRCSTGVFATAEDVRGQAGRPPGDSALRQDHGAPQEAQLRP